MTVSSFHVRYAFQSESTLSSCLNVKELLAQNRRNIRSVIDCNGTRTHNHLVRKRTLNHLAKLAKWLKCVLSTYLCGAFDCMFWSCHVRVSECMARNSLLETGRCTSLDIQATIECWFTLKRVRYITRTYSLNARYR